MTALDAQELSPDFRDRKIGLVVFGILQIVLGAICGLLVPLMVFGAIASQFVEGDTSAPPMTANMIIPGILFYVALAVWFIWMGIGSVRTRRWARALVLVSSWIWLISGIGGLVAVVLTMPDVYSRMAEKGQIPEGVVQIMTYTMIAFMAVIYVIIPVLLVAFYGSKHVKATCEYRDPQVRWTDKCPLPVLAVSLMFTVGAGSLLFMGFYQWVIPFFGEILDGVQGALVTVAIALLMAYIAWGTYRLRIMAWWLSILAVITWSASVAITFSRISFWELYERMNFPQEQIDMMKEMVMLKGPIIAVFVGIWAVIALGYLIYTRRYYRAEDSMQNPELL